MLLSFIPFLCGGVCCYFCCCCCYCCSCCFRCCCGCCCGCCCVCCVCCICFFLAFPVLFYLLYTLRLLLLLLYNSLPVFCQPHPVLPSSLLHHPFSVVSLPHLMSYISPHPYHASPFYFSVVIYIVCSFFAIKHHPQRACFPCCFRSHPFYTYYYPIVRATCSQIFFLHTFSYQGRMNCHQTLFLTVSSFRYSAYH